MDESVSGDRFVYDSKNSVRMEESVLGDRIECLRHCYYIEASQKMIA
jgi:hypothetical protein